MTTSVDEAIAALYGEPLDGFVGARDAMAREARSRGDRALADAIKSLRKPTVAADALNRAIRADPGALDELLDAVDRLRRTQEAMLVGEPADFGADQATYRAAVDAVVANATAHEVEVRAAVEAAAIGGLAGELRAAAFVVLPEPSGGFGPFAAGPGSAAPRAARARSGSGTDDDEAADDGDGATGAGEGGAGVARGSSAAERRMAERARRAADRAVGIAEEHHRRARAVAAEAAERLATIDGQVADLTERLEQARRSRDDAVVARAEADAATATAAELLDEARSALDAL